MQLRFDSPDSPVTLARRLVQFPLKLVKPKGFRADRPATWPRLDGQLELIEGDLFFMPPCADYQQDVTSEVVRLLGNWSVTAPGFVVASNEAGILLGGDARAADAAVWRRADVGPHQGRFRRVPPVLAVEVAGEDETVDGLLEKAVWYRSHGVKTVWLVFPRKRDVVVVTARSSKRLASRAVLVYWLSVNETVGE